MAEKAVSIQVFGRVQGVGFRYHTREAAKRFGVKGFVKNQIDGTVYVEAEGDGLAMDLFCDWCRKGPNWAEVIKVNICNLAPQGFMAFDIK
ncbi:acylphosphatase [Ancylomarina longa]|uniref:Acylphosphatase n=2 Tax=Ancylomarina longa TaxID=2487017 RepID=A0A434AVN3_9BACT|nr:acylphosphatase [Ancylomarina longa]